MAERSTPATFEVPEADLVEQSVPAYPEPGPVDDAAPDPEPVSVERDIWSANPADVAEQSIEVPLDDDREDTAESPGYGDDTPTGYGQEY